MRVKSLAQEHNTMTWPRLKLGPLDPEFSALTIRPQMLPNVLPVDTTKFFFHERLYKNLK